MKIDIFCHITPPKYLAAFEKKVSPEVAKQLPCKFLPTLSDLEQRFRVMDTYEDMVQVLTITNPAVETVLEPPDAVELARLVNDELAELIVKYPDRFVGAVACLPMNDMDAALIEVDRAINDLDMKGVQIYSNIMGKELDSPEFMPLYEKMAQYNLPIWIHPWHPYTGSVAKDEKKFAAYRVFKEDATAMMIKNIFGLPTETLSATTRLVYSPVFNKYPNIKFITHHAGSSIPYFAGRIAMGHDMAEARGGIKAGLTRPPLDYYRLFYADTALFGNTPALMCSYQFFGADHILFGTDMPFDAEIGIRSIHETVEAIENMEISDKIRKQIYEDNARRLLRLSI